MSATGDMIATLELQQRVERIKARAGWIEEFIAAAGTGELPVAVKRRNGVIVEVQHQPGGPWAPAAT